MDYVVCFGLPQSKKGIHRRFRKSPPPRDYPRPMSPSCWRCCGRPEITLGSVMMALGEPLFDDPGYCERHAGTEAEGACVHHGNSCTLRALWLTLEQWMRHTMNQITLADFLQGEHRITDLLRARLADAVLEPAAPLITLTPLSRN